MSHESTRLIKSGPSKTFPACHLQHPKNRQHKGRHSEGDFAFCRFVLVLSRVVYTCSDWKGVLPLIIGTGSSTPEVESLTGSHATEHSDFLQAFLLSDRFTKNRAERRTNRQTALSVLARGTGTLSQLPSIGPFGPEIGGLPSGNL